MGELYRMVGESRIDDDYLTGLSNKGIVKRAYKDIETADIKICGETEDGLSVAVDDVTCRLSMPLGESTCSCPSRSMCRHIITAILYVKKEYGAQQSAETQQSPEVQQSIEAQTEDFSEILDYPLATIKKQLGVNGLRNIYEHIIMENNASINETSIVTVELLDRGVKVKLLVPLKYSTCSCGRKEFCVHRAEAILRYQIDKGKSRVDDIDALLAEEEEQKADVHGIRTLAEEIKRMLGEMISTGLARLSPELVSGCERYAIMCHNGRLAELENKFRALSEQLRLYFGRHASFRVEKLLSDVTKLYGEAAHIAHLEDERELHRLTSRMRTEYVPSKPLDLVGMGYRHFKSQTGYAGTVIYFMEEHTGSWYTYTDARPLYYEGRRAVRMTGKEPAPWGLSCSMEELAQSRIHLSGCRVNHEGRLSSTSEARAELVGARELTSEGAGKNSYRNFARLFAERFPSPSAIRERQERECLVLIYPDRIPEAFFDSVRQRFLMRLEDAEGSGIQVQIDYSNEESYNIKYLERVYQQISRKKKKPACFFGRIYVSEGMLKLYPIEYYGQELKGKEKEEAGAFLRVKRARQHMETEERYISDEAIGGGEYPAVIGLKDCLESCANLMTQILQSGFVTVPVQTIEDIRQMQTTALQYGLRYGAEELGALAAELERRRHETEVQGQETLVTTFVGLNLYITEALSKVKYDEAAWKLENHEK